ncbi:hypothetical protein FA95DRAFT_1497567 [Auriscalpium vulgare]|uniref:Uncharacterized protein n=1 Tax=Auriscalpium vulgare TaxID=40419 RepID=A0ACB8RJ35_9AGAM|nr:hypothetical protein FA95DRAFT_1497567 [Auriscalpium vulgare]
MLRSPHLAVARAGAIPSVRLHPSRSFSASASRQKQRLVILGSGWGGYEVLRRIDKKRWSAYLSRTPNSVTRATSKTARGHIQSY